MCSIPMLSGQPRPAAENCLETAAQHQAGRDEHPRQVDQHDVFGGDNGEILEAVGVWRGASITSEDGGDA